MNEEIYLKWLKKTSNLELLIRASRRYFGVEEEWRDVAGWEGLYEVSSFGRVKNLEREVSAKCGVKLIPECIRALRLSNKGYPRVNLSICNNIKTIQVHRLVVDAFHDNPDKKATTNHRNGIKWDNRAVNLEHNTYSENIKHAFRVLGKRNHTARRVNQLDLDGNFIKKWDTIKDAYLSLGLGSHAITRNLKGEDKMQVKYKWEYAD